MRRFKFHDYYNRLGGEGVVFGNNGPVVVLMATGEIVMHTSSFRIFEETCPHEIEWIDEQSTEQHRHCALGKTRDATLDKTIVYSETEPKYLILGESVFEHTGEKTYRLVGEKMSYRNGMFMYYKIND